ncbi:hypothetical protein QTO34_017112 [Cnephaeus nilssonii]|uniref:BZIP domain-containing protein n=1 Tax=Cnephaeus nilssonii TaxID=3371016 RepID=A0AA40I0D3_CNENI|nr:hypothetical protein QTO34_017112 [Eptesicus nilssonii]
MIAPLHFLEVKLGKRPQPVKSELDEEGEWRKRLWEKNKVVAARCQNKKMERTEFLQQESEWLELMNAELKTQMEELKQKRQQLILMLNQHCPTCIVRTDSIKTPTQKATHCWSSWRRDHGLGGGRRGGGDEQREEKEGPSAETKVVLSGTCSAWGQACRRQDRGSGPERYPTRQLWLLLRPLHQALTLTLTLILMQGWRRAQCQALMYPLTMVQLSPAWSGSWGTPSPALLELLWARGTGPISREWARHRQTGANSAPGLLEVSLQYRSHFLSLDAL